MANSGNSERPNKKMPPIFIKWFCEAPYLSHHFKGEGHQGSSNEGSCDHNDIHNNAMLWRSNIRNEPKPHHANSAKWETIKSIVNRDKGLSQRHFEIIKPVGKGCAGFALLSRLEDTGMYFVLKVMNRSHLERMNKPRSIENEIEVLKVLDHPCLPTLYHSFEMDMYTALVMDYCPGGDLYSVQKRQPGRCFSEKDTRFYAAEVLLALEYLHLLGIVYRDLKPENILIKEDGHIMLTDFDLAMKADFSPTLARGPSSEDGSEFSRAVACFHPRILKKWSTGNVLQNLSNLASSIPELQAEPTSVHSMSAVGTYEYLAPEISEDKPHGSAVDWWAFGILLYELLFGRTPFVGQDDLITAANIRGKALMFPQSSSLSVSLSAKDLIKQLLVKDPTKRLGCKRGASEIKRQPFFYGTNWALLLSSNPPLVPVLVHGEEDSEQSFA